MILSKQLISSDVVKISLFCIFFSALGSLCAQGPKDGDVIDHILEQVVASENDQVIDPVYREMVAGGYKVIYTKRLTADGWQVHGPMTIFSREGEIVSVINFKDGRRNGPEVFWHANGAVASLRSCIDGVTEGMAYSWSDTGLLLSMEKYLNGAKHGDHLYWNEDKSLVRRISWRRGKLVEVTVIEDGGKARILTGKEAKAYILDVARKNRLSP